MKDRTMKLVRLKPYNGKSHKLRSYTVFGIKFDSARGWYKVDDDVADYLADVKQSQHGANTEYSPAAFDIVKTVAEAQALEELQKKKALKKTAAEANDTLVHDVARRSKVGHAQATQEAADRGRPPAKPPVDFDNLDGTFPDGDMAPRRSKPVSMVDGADAADDAADTEPEARALDLSNEPDGDEEADVPAPPRAPSRPSSLLPQPSRPKATTSKKAATGKGQR